MTEEGRTRRSDTVWRRRSTGSTAATKTGTEGFRINNFRTQHLMRSGDSINGRFDQPLPSQYTVIDMLPKVGCLGLSQRHFAYKGDTLTT
jgi:hypothetical protein